MADPRKVPIDIAYRKLLEGLIDRKIVPSKWSEQHQQIRDGLAVLYPELPAASDALIKFKAKAPTHDELTYFDCKHVLELLQTSSEGTAKNFFGQYSSPVIKKWTALVRLYEKNNVFAAEGARVVTQNTAFEIPFLKKTIQQNEKQIADNKRKMADLTKSIAEYKRKLEASCAEIGIPGNHFREELQRLPAELPTIFGDVASRICADDIATAIAYHAALQTYLHNCEVPVAATPAVPTTGGKKDKKNAKAQDVLVVTDDEYTPFEYFTTLKALQAASEETVEPSPVTLDFEAEAVDIDWDISVDGGGTEATIDWGIELEPSTDAATVGSDDSGVHVDLSGEEAAADIDWDITTDVAVSGDDAGFDISSGGFTIGGDSPAMIADEPVNKSSRVGLLSDNEFRGRVLNELLELKLFLRQRREELADKTSTNVAFASQFHGTSPLLEHQSDEKVKGYLAAVEEAIAQLTHKRLQQLVLIKNSDRFLDRHVASLEMLTKHMDKCEREIRSLEDKNMDLADATSRLQPQIDALIATTKRIKRELEAALPPLFKGYKVNIVGDVNNL